MIQILKVNESQYIALFVFTGSIKKLFSIDCVDIYLLSILFSIDFTRWESVTLPPHCLYCNSLTYRIILIYLCRKLLRLDFKRFQKQPFRGVLKKRYSENMQQIYRRTRMTKCDFNKVAKATLLKWHFGMGVLL